LGRRGLILSITSGRLTKLLRVMGVNSPVGRARTGQRRSLWRTLPGRVSVSLSEELVALVAQPPCHRTFMLVHQSSGGGALMSISQMSRRPGLRSSDGATPVAGPVRVRRTGTNAGWVPHCRATAE